MKSYLLLLFCLFFCCRQGYAQQTGLFLTATGYGSITGNISGQDADQFTGAFKTGLECGYQWNNWQLSTGIHYMQTGYRQPLFPLGQPTRENFYQQYKFVHILIPLEAGYNLLPGRRVGVIPALGLSFSRNIAMRYLTNYNRYERRVSGAEFRQHYQSFSFFGQAGIRISYRLSERFALLAGSQCFFMLHNLKQQTAVTEPDLYLLSVQAGAGLQFSF